MDTLCYSTHALEMKFKMKLASFSFSCQIIVLFLLLSVQFHMWKRLLSPKVHEGKIPLASGLGSPQETLVWVTWLPHLSLAVSLSMCPQNKTHQPGWMIRGLLQEAVSWSSSRWLNRARFLQLPHLVHQFSAPSTHWNQVRVFSYLFLGILL